MGLRSMARRMVSSKDRGGLACPWVTKDKNETKTKAQKRFQGKKRKEGSDIHIPQKCSLIKNDRLDIS
jgi:hypothetical protein